MERHLMNFLEHHKAIQKSLQYRDELFKDPGLNAFRLMNGFIEGPPQLVVDKFADTLLVWDYSEAPSENTEFFDQIWQWYLESIPAIKSVLLKSRNSKLTRERNGNLVFGERPDQVIVEHGVQYTLNLSMNQDASFYLDTRNLRKWLIDNSKGLTILNTFAYTGSLGTAAMAGGASRVLQTDLSSAFLNLAKLSYSLNGFQVNKRDFIQSDFFNVVGMLKKQENLFDCVILDPPFFSRTKGGQIDLLKESNRLINKIRPLVKHEGRIIMVNNALFLSGKEFLDQIENLCADGYMEIEEIIPVSQDVTGYPETVIRPQPVDPNPFNHSTKIIVMRVFRKDKK